METVQLKKDLRIKIRQETARLDRGSIVSQSEKVFDYIERTPQFQQARDVAIFWSLSDEIPTHDFIRRWTGFKNIYLPFLEDGKMYFSKITPETKFTAGDHRIMEPTTGQVANPWDIDLMIVPGVAFDRDNYRLGRGKGYYDRFLCDSGITTFGVCLDHQLVDSVPRERHDVPVHRVFRAADCI